MRFFRCSELLNIRCSDVAFQKSHMSIFIETSKTDIYRDGQWVVIARSNSGFIPVKKFEMFFSWCGFIEDCTEDCTNFIFCNLSKTKSRHKLRNGDKALKYTRMQELFIEVFQGFVPDISKKKPGLHSFRAGGPIVFANSGISDGLFKIHGKWKSESVYFQIFLYSSLYTNSFLLPLG